MRAFVDRLLNKTEPPLPEDGDVDRHPANSRRLSDLAGSTLLGRPAPLTNEKLAADTKDAIVSDPGGWSPWAGEQFDLGLNPDMVAAQFAPERYQACITDGCAQYGNVWRAVPLIENGLERWPDLVCGGCGVDPTILRFRGEVRPAGF